MAIQINDNWQIETDGRLNFTLQQKKIIENSKDPSRNGETKWVDVGYYPTYQTALKGLIRREVAVPDNIKYLVNKLSELESLVMNLPDHGAM
ncbi:MAG: hypothetical protein H6Q72_4775 [Firmicutes bacterium]|nr:hypothetical protein [Bacillota bacterium]